MQTTNFKKIHSFHRFSNPRPSGLCHSASSTTLQCAPVLNVMSIKFTPKHFSPIRTLVCNVEYRLLVYYYIPLEAPNAVLSNVLMYSGTIH
jgi:hypothetical protein